MIHDLKDVIAQAHAAQAAFIVAADYGPHLVTPPGELDVDIVVGTTQRFGMHRYRWTPRGLSGLP